MRFYTFTNINKMKNNLSPEHIEHKSRPQHIAFGNSCRRIGKAYISGSV